MISGGHLTLFLDSNHQVWSCGLNELGLGYTEARGVPTPIPDLEHI